MAGSGEGGRKWLAYGCFGCLGVIVLFALVVLGLFGMARMSVNSEQVEDRVITPEIPTPAQPVTPPATGEALPVNPAAIEKTGKIVLDLAHGEFHIEPARPGEPLHIDASYDKQLYELVERLETEGDRWSYEVRFRRTGSGMMSFLRQIVGGSTPSVEVYLPSDVPLNLSVELEQGGAKVELGGLWLTSADLEFGQGGFELSVDEPLRAPMERLAIHGSMGGFSARRLGNASPRELDVDFRMGGMELDLQGQWVRDADVSISFGMGGGNVRLPRDVEIVGLTEERPVVRRDPEIKPPILTFSVSGDLDNLQFN